MAIIIFEPKLTGHHLSYVQGIISALECKELTLCVIDIQENRNALKKLDRERVAIEFLEHRRGIEYFGGALNDIRRELAYWIMAKKWFNRYLKTNEPPSAIIVPYLDYFLNVLGVLGSPFGKTPIMGITMRVSFHHASLGIAERTGKFYKIKEYCFISLLKNKNLKKIWAIDETLFHYKFSSSVSSGLKGRAKLEYLADPCVEPRITDRLVARAALNISPDVEQIALVYGSIDLRKGVRTILDAANALQKKGGSLLVIVAGRQSPEATALIGVNEYDELRNKGLLLEVNRYIDEELEGIVFCASDVVWVGYSGHLSMSNVLVKAANYGKLIIGCAEGLIGWYCRKLDSAQVIDVSSVDSAVAAFNRARVGISSSNMATAVFKGNTWNNFQEKIALQLGKYL